MAKKAPQKVKKVTQNPKPGSPKLTAKTPRKRKAPEYRSFRLHKRIKPSQPKLPSAFRLMVRSIKLLKANWKLFGVLTIIYGVLTVVLVRGVGGGLNLKDLKSSFADVFSGRLAGLGTAALLFSTLIGSAGSSSSDSGSVMTASVGR